MEHIKKQRIFINSAIILIVISLLYIVFKSNSINIYFESQIDNITIPNLNLSSSNQTYVRYRFYKLNISDPITYINNYTKPFLRDLVKNATKYCTEEPKILNSTKL
jgi:hypothetical protein